MNNVRNGALTVLFKVRSLITITRSVSSIAAFNSLKQPFHVKIYIYIYIYKHNIWCVSLRIKWTYQENKKGVTTEGRESKQQALIGTRVNIDSRWAPTGIAKLWVSLPKQGVAMATISRRITRIIGEHK